MNYDILIIDGPYLAHRSFEAPFKLTTSKGLDATMIYSFLITLNSLRKKFNPKEIKIAWESPGTPSWRRELMPLYKPPKSLQNLFIDQNKDLQILLYLLGFNQFKSDCNEADDVIATLALNEINTKLIFTVDKDIMQIINPLVNIYNGKEIINESKVKEKFGIFPHQIPDLLAITGDNADNIKGIDGYGYKKASKILKQYGYIENIPNTELINKYRIKLILNKRLTRLNSHAPLTTITFDTTLKVNDILDKYELKKIKENINMYKIENKHYTIDDFF